MPNAGKFEGRPFRRRRHVVLVLLVIAVSLLAALIPTRAHAQVSGGGSSTSSSKSTPEYTKWDDLSGKTVGMVTGATFESALREKCPNVGDVVYYSSTSDLIAALRAKKVDAFINSMAVGTLASNRYSDLALFPEVLGKYEIGVAFPNGSNLAPQFAQIMDRLRSDGTSDKLWDKWTAGDNGNKTVPKQDWAGANGTYTVATCQGLEPVSYLGDGQMLGFDIEMLLTCAKELDVHLDFKPVEFLDVLSYIQSGKADFGCGSILITKERAEAMDFAHTHENDLILVVRAADGGSGSQGSFIDGIVESFHKTFIRENRWTIILSGLGTTMIITLSSAVLGTALGFISVLLRRRGNRVAGVLVGAFEGLMNRLPIVVMLMVFYYVIFGSANLSGTVVSIIAFTLAFGATAGSIMWSSVRAVDGGQSEASLALGFTETKPSLAWCSLRRRTSSCRCCPARS